MPTCVCGAQAQCEALPSVLGVVREVELLARSLWFLLLPHTELLDLSLGYQ